MGRLGWIAAVATALMGFFVGRGLAPSTISFPAPEEGRSTRQMESIPTTDDWHLVQIGWTRAREQKST